MDQGPLTHTNGGSTLWGAPPGGSQEDPILDPLFAGSKIGGPGGTPPGGGVGPPRPRAGGPKLSPPGDGGHLTDFVAN